MLAHAYEADEFEWGEVDLGTLVSHTVQRWRPSAERQWAVEPGTVVIEADESRLEAALDALIENAVKFTVDGDAITLRCQATHNGGAVLEVIDTGVGFEVAGGGGVPRTSGRPGTGLGLSIVRAIAEGHGGRLSVLEGDRATGSRVQITLPPRRPAGRDRPPA
jgi:two-component system, OmpR family, sensor kinase